MTGKVFFGFALASSMFEGDCNIHRRMLTVAQVKRDAWALPGITVHVTSDAEDMSVVPVDGHLDITYREATRFELRFESNRR